MAFTAKSKNTIALAASHSRLWKDMITEFQALHPGAKVAIKQENLGTYHQRLLDGTLDFVLTGLADLNYPDLNYHVLGQWSLVLCCLPSCPLAQKASVELTELEGYPYVDLSEELSFRRYCDTVFEKAGVHPRRVCECTSELRPEMLRAYNGICVTSSASLNRELYKGFVFVPIRGEIAVRKIAIFWNKRKAFTPLMEEFFAAVTKSVSYSQDSNDN